MFTNTAYFRPTSVKLTVERYGNSASWKTFVFTN